MLLRRTAAAALGLLTLVPVLAACGGDGSDVDTGQVVPAREDAQFAAGDPSSVMLPLGRLEILLGEPTTDLTADDTRQLEPIEAPEGSTFVPITWQYDGGTFGDYADYIGTDATPAIDLVSDGASYRLPAPEPAGEGSESFYVLVDGSADEPSLKVEYDGVTQTVDLRTGDRDPDRAKPLYKLTPRRDRTTSCTTNAKFGKEFVRLPDFTCSVTRTARLPYAGGEWAEEGRSWLVVTVQTSLRRYDQIADDLRSGAIYFAGAVESSYQLGSLSPTTVIQDRTLTACPDPVKGGCSSVDHLIFDVGDKAPGRLRVNQDYDLYLSSVWGGGQGKDVIGLPVTVGFPLR